MDSVPFQCCPNCHVMIEKVGGCQYLRCVCGHQFCWCCLREKGDKEDQCQTKHTVPKSVLEKT